MTIKCSNGSRTGQAGLRLAPEPARYSMGRMWEGPHMKYRKGPSKGSSHIRKGWSGKSSHNCTPGRLKEEDGTQSRLVSHPEADGKTVLPDT